jgi:WD40 repeat protein
MELETALAFTDAIVFEKQGVHLSDLQRAMLRESWSWQRQSYDQIAEAYGYSSTYLKHDVGPKLWKLISAALEEKVNKTSFRAAIERRFLTEATPELQPQPQPRESANLSWDEAPDISNFYDREAELTQLQSWILDQQCRLITILGMGGMGKTSLSVKLAHQLQDQFEWVVWRSLRNAPPLQDLVAELLQNFVQAAVIPETVAEKVSSLLKFLRSHRCLVVLDNAEVIAKDHEDYHHLFRQIGETRHQSCVVLTSRELPDAVRLMQGETLPVRSLNLAGLSIPAGQQLFALKGRFQGSISDWNRLISHYSGNPLALKLISTTIQTIFDGSISDFLSEDTFVFGDVRSLIRQQFEGLSELDKAILYWLAIDREPDTFAALRSHLFPKVQPEKLIDSLETLEHRSLIEKQPSGFSLQPVVMEYAIDQLVQHITQEILSEAAPVLLRTHALLNPQAKDYIRHTQIRLILTPILEQISTQLSDRVESHLIQRLQYLRSQSASKVGYAGGNLLNLFCQQQNNLTDCDLSDLILWQADLRQTDLHYVDLSHSDLSHSAFTEAFGVVFSVAFSPDGLRFAIGDAEGRLKLWEVSTGELLMQREAHIGWIWSLAFSPDGQTLATGSSDRTIRLWDVKTGDCLKKLEGQTSTVWTVAFSPDGAYLASGDDRQIVRWHLETGHCNRWSGHKGQILAIAFSPDGKHLASGSDDQTVRLWNLNSGNCEKTFTGHTNRVSSVAFSPASDWIASGSADRTIRIWSIQSGQCIRQFEGHEDRVRSIALSSDAQTLISSGDGQTIRVWQVNTGSCLTTLRGHRNAVLSIALNQSGIIVSGGIDLTIRLWSLQTGQCLKTLHGYTNAVVALGISPDGTTIISGGTDRVIRSWNIQTGKCEKILRGHEDWVTSITIHPDGNWIASGSLDRTVRLWSLQTNQCLAVFRDHTNWVQSVAFSPNGEFLASGSDDLTIRIWSISTRQCVKVLQGHTSWVWAVCFSPDGTQLASSSDDQTIRIWEVETGNCLSILKGHTQQVQTIAFNKTGALLASGSSDQTVRVWSVKTGHCLKTLHGHQNGVCSVAFGSEGELASASLDQTVRLWHLDTETCRQTLPVFTYSIRSTIAICDRTLANGNQDGTIQLWDMDSGDCLQTFNPDRPYQATNIADMTGINAAQRSALKILGAIER